ncbi:hypothetical protein M409DRAFT_37128 [Zasmidium cellare ATCC 36951]|uniref:AB hydrolase-1 domain-containing protein n=1 Tax=Zasmidium cellare ATCC 36951 TaxID=1080233 RepID=A0A6A6CDF4_ZASCE|nr:uncharacterized protein M409DRAFT_37128 [Zasmidium cellare ATCC 36951]KAF2164208.1 hypothetical protein M409DRAFT_37128 [Zasmidium cellare ATCC 36951]
MTTHQTAKTQYIQSKDITYAYRQFGPKSNDGLVPLLFLHHFRASMDWWDPLLINSIAAHRPVILFDNAGVGKSRGKVDSSVKDMASHALDFLKLLGINEVDVLGFSMGGFIAQILALEAPKGLIRRLIIAGSSPSWGSGVEQRDEARSQEINANAAGAEAKPENMQKLFFYDSESSHAAARAYWSRIHERTKETSGEERTELVSWQYADGGEGLQNMANALGRWSSEEQRAEGSFDRLAEVKVPVLIGQGKDDFTISTVNSFVLQQKLPDARLKIWPDSGHGFLFQFAEEFAGDVVRFLS